MNRTSIRPLRLHALSAAALLACAGSTALAADAAPAPDASASQVQAPQLPAQRVRAKAIEEQANGPVEGYRARRSATATKTDTPLNETPESVTVITREEILDQGATGLQDALNYAAGVRSNAYGLDSRSDGTRIRGTAPDEYEDGLRRLFNWYTSNTRVEPYTLERIEVLRGPAALMYGQGSTGGLINTVSKRPQAETQREVGVQIGSWNRRQVRADLTGALTDDGQWLYRLVALKRKADTQVDHVRDDRAVLAPSLTWKPSGSTSWTLLALWQQDRSGSTSQFFPWEGVATPTADGRRIPTHTFIGDPDWDRYDSDRASLTSVFEHRFDSGWTLKQNLRSSYNKVDYRSLYGDSFTVPGTYAAGSPSLFGRFADGSLTKVRMLSADQNVEGTLQTGPLAHRVLLGLDVVEYKQASASGFDYPIYYPPEYAGTVPLIDVYAPDYSGFTPPTLAANPLSYQRQIGLYLQDQVKLDRWTLVAGLRRDRAVSGVEDEPAQRNYATSRRLGLIHAFDNGWSPYVNYSESFTPVAAVNGQILKPLRGRQVEAGAKFQPADGSILFTAAAYKLRESNRTTNPTPDTYVQIDDTKTQGVELELKTSLTKDIDLIAHYNYTDIDKQLEQLPKSQAAVWGKWRFSIAGIEGFSVGAGVRWMSAFRDVAVDAQTGEVVPRDYPKTPSVTLVDAMFAWENPTWRAAVNVTNLSDKVYYSTCLSRGDCWYGARRSVIGSLSYRF